METNNPPPTWDAKVQKTLSSVHREASILMWLGFIVYGAGSAAILVFVKNPGMATATVMYLFQLLVLFFGTRKMYPAIAGGFRIGLDANRSSMPLFEKTSAAIERLETDPESHPVVKAVMARVDSKISPVLERWDRIGTRVEEVVLPRLEKAIESAAESVRKLDVKASSTFEGVKRVQQQIEGELATGLLNELREAAQAVKLMAAPHAPTKMPAFNDVLASLSKPKTNGAAAPVPQGGRS